MGKLWVSKYASSNFTQDIFVKRRLVCGIISKHTRKNFFNSFNPLPLIFLGGKLASVNLATGKGIHMILGVGRIFSEI